MNNQSVFDNNNFKVSELAGCEVFTLAGEKIGVLTDVLPTAANDVWVIAAPGMKDNELLLPALAAVVKEVDVVHKKISVDLPKGLREIYETTI